jgi:ribosomal protein S18 acetylase RimI-like enzyme
MSVSLREMSEAELTIFLERHEGEYAAERTASGEPPATARAKAAASIAELFPGGRPASGHLVFNVVDDEETIGLLWIGPHPNGHPASMWVWSVEIAKAYRGLGAGRRAMELAEGVAIGLGAAELGLNVFGHNEVAVGLYRSLGYQPTSIQMRKVLSPGQEEPAAGAGT